MLRGWTNPSRYLSERKQAEMLVEVGVEKRVIYSGPDEWEAFVRALRPGDKAVVADLSVFGSRKALREALEAVVARQATLATPGVDIHPPTLLEVSRTETKWAGQRAMPTGQRARELGAKGNEAYRKKLRASRMDETAAKAIWKDAVRYPTRAEALEHMPGWTAVTAWRKWKGRDVKSEE